MRGRPTIRLSNLMLVLAFGAVGLAALRYASGTWARLVFSLTLLVLGLGVLRLVARGGAGRPYWLGFCLCGWGYLAACFGPWCAGEVRPHLITTWALERAAPWVVHPRVLTLRRVNGSWTADVVGDVLAMPDDREILSTPGYQGRTTINLSWPAVIYHDALSPGDPEHVLRIGHSLFALLAAMVGGHCVRGWSVDLKGT